MQFLLSICRVIDRITAGFGMLATWAVLLSCLISAGNAGSRYLFSESSNAWLEIQWYLFSVIFLLGAAHTLRCNGHVRVDILYMQISERAKLWVDLFGLIFFLLPACALLGYMGWHLFLESYLRGEMSSNAGGLIRWPVKLVMPAGFALLTLQGVSELIKRIAALAGVYHLDAEYHRQVQ
jgi:TRAP-type mannitol/chloroaromatic compound transport system permease small subunit